MVIFVVVFKPVKKPETHELVNLHKDTQLGSDGAAQSVCFLSNTQPKIRVEKTDYFNNRKYLLSAFACITF